jgi:hypothetical protein
MTAAPRLLVVRRGPHVMRLELDPALEARAARPSDAPLPGERMSLEGGALRVCEARAQRPSGPVYRLHPSEETAVPTGRVFVTLRDPEARVGAHRETLEGLGFEIESVPEHAPHAGWLRPRAGDVPRALAALEALSALAFVARADPQILLRGRARGG